MTLAKTAVAGPMTLATDKRPLAPEIQARSSLPQGTAEALLEREGSHVVETVEVNVQERSSPGRWSLQVAEIR